MSNLVKVYEHTVHHCTKNRRKYEKPQPLKYSGILPNYTPPKPFNETKADILVLEKDTITASLELQDEKLNPLVLNMSSSRVPGGGVSKGARAQEESLFRRTNYFQHLDPDFYPLDDFEVVYTPNVAVIKDENHNLLDSPEYLTFIACPGIKNPEYQKNGRMSSRCRHILRQKIRMIFQVAAYHGHDSLVLGALGCGAYKCYPEHVVEQFNKVTTEFQPGTFRKIVYAINSQNRDSNFEVFDKKISRE